MTCDPVNGELHGPVVLYEHLGLFCWNQTCLIDEPHSFSCAPDYSVSDSISQNIALVGTLQRVEGMSSNWDLW